MNRPLSVRLAALAEAEKILPRLLESAYELYGVYGVDQRFYGDDSKRRAMARLDVLQRLKLAAPALSDGQAAKLLHVDPRTIQRMREKIRSLEFKGHTWRLRV